MGMFPTVLRMSYNKTKQIHTCPAIAQSCNMLYICVVKKIFSERKGDNFYILFLLFQKNSFDQSIQILSEIIYLHQFQHVSQCMLCKKTTTFYPNTNGTF